MGYHALSSHEKTEEQGKTSHKESDFPHHPTETEEELADKLTQCKAGLSLQSLRIHDLTTEQRNGPRLFMDYAESEDDEAPTVPGEDMMALDDSKDYLTDLLSGIEVMKYYEEQRYPFVVRDIPLIVLRSETSKMDIPDDARKSLESLFKAVEKYQERPGSYVAQCQITAAHKEIENLPDGDAVSTIRSSTMLNILLDSITQPSIKIDDLEDIYCKE